MIPDNVTVIVKAPNQQIEDQSIDCETCWSVKQLKGHLAEVYPSKPRTDEQKIIYSGQLLDDNIILKDVLRTYESQNTHTMHLVCTPKRNMAETRMREPATDGLRQRNVTTEAPRPVETATRPEMRQNDQNHTVEMQNYLSSFVNNYGRIPPYPANFNLGEGYLPVPNDPAMLANHMMMMQQAYLQYMQQYANMWQATDNQPPPPAEAPPPAPEVPAAAPEDEDGPPRDWLDHLYTCSRLAILFSLVYLYGSPVRMLLVFIVGAMGYLFQIGFFRDIHLIPNNEPVIPINIPDVPAAAENLDQNIGNQNPGNQNIGNQNPGNQNNGNQNQGNQNIGNQNQGNQNNGNQNVNNQNQGNQNQGHQPTGPARTPTDGNDYQSLLAYSWMVVSTFFASLVPDTN